MCLKKPPRPAPGPCGPLEPTPSGRVCGPMPGRSRGHTPQRKREPFVHGPAPRSERARAPHVHPLHRRHLRGRCPPTRCPRHPRPCDPCRSPRPHGNVVHLPLTCARSLSGLGEAGGGAGAGKRTLRAVAQQRRRPLPFSCVALCASTLRARPLPTARAARPAARPHPASAPVLTSPPHQRVPAAPPQRLTVRE